MVLVENGCANVRPMRASIDFEVTYMFVKRENVRAGPCNRTTQHNNSSKCVYSPFYGGD